VKTHTPTPAEMEKRIARFNTLKPVNAQYDAADGIPAEAYRTVSANGTYILMGPAGLKSATGEQPPVLGGDGGEVFTVNIAKCPPGNGSPLHAHQYTHETFFCLNGRFEVKWGDKGEHSIFLEPMDMIAVPPGVVRNFTNITDREADLLVFIQGDRDRFRDVDFPATMGQTIEQRFGPEVRRRLEDKGLVFTAGQDVPLPIDMRKAAE